MQSYSCMPPPRCALVVVDCQRLVATAVQFVRIQVARSAFVLSRLVAFPGAKDPAALDEI